MKLPLPSLGVPFVEILAAGALVALAAAAWVTTRPDGLTLTRNVIDSAAPLCDEQHDGPCGGDEVAPTLRSSVDG